MWPVAAFAALGFLVGNLVGLTAESVTSALLGLLFAFGGGSAIAFLQKLDPSAQALAGKAIFALAISCLAGVYTGIIVTERQVLTPAEAPTPRTQAVADLKYLRAGAVAEAHSIDQRLANQQLQLREAYREMYDLFVELEVNAGSIDRELEANNVPLEQAYANLRALILAEDGQ